MNWKILVLGLVVMLALFVGGCAKKAAEPTAPVTTQPEAPAVTEPEAEEMEEAAPVPVSSEVMVNRQNFDPAELTVVAGSTLTFKNMDDRVHIVSVKGVSDAKSPKLYAEDTWDYTFEEAGEFEVMDVIFGFKMMVTVE